jgi:amino acid transporter
MSAVAERPRGGERLVRAVGLWGLIAFCINAVVGSGIYLLPSESYELLGPFSLWVPLLFALPVFVLVLNFAEAASHFTQAGGVYLYAKTAFGDFVGFETGWMNALARISSLAALSNGLVVSIAFLLPGANVGVARIALLTGTLLLFGAIHAVGIRFGARAIYTFTIGKLLPLLILVVAALALFRHNPFPASVEIPGAGAKWNEAALLMLFAYAGFENIGVPAAEYENPRRELPIALLAGTLSIAALYVLVQLAALATLPDLSGTGTPLADVAAVLLGGAGAALLSVGAIVSITGSNLGTVLEGSRLIFALCEGRRPYQRLASVHPRFRTPVVAICVLIGLAIPLAIAGSFAQLALLSAVARLTTYLVGCAAVPRLRKLSSRPGFRTPGGLLFPVLGVVISAALFFTLGPRHLVASVIALAVGAVLWAISRAYGEPILPEPEFGDPVLEGVSPSSRSPAPDAA